MDKKDNSMKKKKKPVKKLPAKVNNIKNKKENLSKKDKFPEKKKSKLKEVSINETTNIKKNPEIKVEKIIDKKNTSECKYCHKLFEKQLTVCPFCNKVQKDNKGKIVIAVLIIILLLAIIANHFIDKYYVEQVSESDYKYNCKLLSYEELVRKPKDYKNTDVKVIGKVVSVEGVDLSYGNVMNVTIDANLFDGENKQYIIFEYTDKDYQMSFIEGDLLTVYGVYTKINGNTPLIKSKYIVFGT